MREAYEHASRGVLKCIYIIGCDGASPRAKRIKSLKVRTWVKKPRTSRNGKIELHFEAYPPLPHAPSSCPEASPEGLGRRYVLSMAGG